MITNQFKEEKLLEIANIYEKITNHSNNFPKGFED
jgi:hypothetical protein